MPILKNDGVRQLELMGRIYYPTYEMENKIHVWNHQADLKSRCCLHKSRKRDGQKEAAMQFKEICKRNKTTVETLELPEQDREQQLQDVAREQEAEKPSGSFTWMAM